MAHILLVEPDRRIRDFVAGILSDCGHAVAACADGAAAAASLAIETVDLVVTDLVLSREGSALRRRCAALGIAVVTLSGSAFRPGRRAAELLPPLVEKPFRFADLRSVLDAARFVPGSVGNMAAARDRRVTRDAA